MSVQQRTVRIKRSVMNSAIMDTLRPSYDEQDYNNAVCECFDLFNILLVLCRFVCFIVYKLLWIALKHNLDPIVNTECFPYYAWKQREASNKLYINPRLQSDVEKHADLFGKQIDDSWMFMEEQDSTYLNSSGDTVDENIHFVTYMEADLGDGFQDDEYNDIMDQYNIVDPLERLLERDEIDWDAPMVPIINNNSEEDQASETSFCSGEGIFIDDDYLLESEGETYKKIYVRKEDLLIEPMYLPVKYKSNNFFWKTSQESIFENDNHILPVYDEDVLAAITGIKRRKAKMCDVAEEAQSNNTG